MMTFCEVNYPFKELYTDIEDVNLDLSVMHAVFLQVLYFTFSNL